MTKTNQIPLSCLHRVKRTANAGRPAHVATDILVCEFVVDRSGSMQPLVPATKRGVQDALLSKLQFARRHGTKVLVSITAFDSTAETWQADYVDVESLPLPLSDARLSELFNARLYTRLTDTLMERMHALGRKLLAVRAANPGKLIKGEATICTDGQDNMSRQWKPSDVRTVIEKMRGDGVHFAFLAANQDAITTASQYGIPAAQALTFTAEPATTAAAFRCARAQAARGASGLPSAYTAMQRQVSVGAALAPSPPMPAPPPRGNRGATWAPGQPVPPPPPRHARPHLPVNVAFAAPLPMPAVHQPAGGRGVSHGGPY